MQKRAQLTVFIIVGIVLVLSVAVVLYITGIKTNVGEGELAKSEQLAFERAAIFSYVTSCLSEFGRKGAYLVGAHGGYINPDGSFKYDEPGDGLPSSARPFFMQSALTYALDGNQKKLRLLSAIEDMLSNYVLIEIESCLNFSTFEDAGWHISKPNINWQAIQFNSSNAVVNYSGVKVNLDVTVAQQSITMAFSYPLLFAREGQQISISEFAISIPLRLGFMYGAAEKMIDGAVASHPAYYNIFENCENYALPDELINIYITQMPDLLQQFVSIVDANMINFDWAPFKFQFAIKNTLIAGQCVG